MTGGESEITVITMIMAEHAIALRHSYESKINSIPELKSHLNVKARGTLALIVKVKRALQVYQGKVKQHKQALNVLVQKQQIEARTPREVHLQVRMQALETVKVAPRVALDVANNETLDREKL